MLGESTCTKWHRHRMYACMECDVPKSIADASAIVASIDQVIESYDNQMYPEEVGRLLTPATQAAWAQLRRHVEAGCLCDAPGIDLHIFSDSSQIDIGGEVFRAFRTLRGTSALEGFHGHQKQWLGPRARHTIRLSGSSWNPAIKGIPALPIATS